MLRRCLRGPWQHTRAHRVGPKQQREHPGWHAGTTLYLVDGNRCGCQPRPCQNHGPELEPGISSRLRESLSACLSSLIRKADDDAIVEWGIRQYELLLLQIRKTCHLAIQVVHGMAQARKLLFLSKRFAHLDRPRAVKLRRKFIALKVPT